MTAFDHFCRVKVRASLRTPAYAESAAPRRSWHPLRPSASTVAAAELPDARRLSVLLLSSRNATLNNVDTTRLASSRSVGADPFLPATVRAACNAFAEFAPQAKFGTKLSSAQLKKDVMQPVRCIHAILSEWRDICFRSQSLIIQASL